MLHLFQLILFQYMGSCSKFGKRVHYRFRGCWITTNRNNEAVKSGHIFAAFSNVKKGRRRHLVLEKSVRKVVNLSRSIGWRHI